MTSLVVKGPNTLPYDIGNFPDFTSDTGAVAPLINTELVRKSFPTMVNYLLPKGDASLFGLASEFKSETAVQIEHGFFAKIMIFPSFVINGAIADHVTTALTVLDNSQVIPNGLYMAIGTTTAGVLTPSTTLDGEIVLVTATSGTTSITVTRGVANVANIADKTTFVHIGNAFADASTRPQSFLTKEIRVVNYTQIFRNAWAIAGSVSAIQNLIGDTNIAKSRMECAQYHAMDIEKSFFFGSRSNTAGVAGTSNAFRTMNGIINQITDGQSSNLFLPGQTSSSNISTANSAVNGAPTAGALSMDDFENWVDNLVNMSYTPQGAMERVIFCGRSGRKVLNRLARLNASYFIENGETQWGLRFNRIQLTRVTAIVIEHPLFNTNLMWSRLLVAIDKSALGIAYLTGRQTKSEEYNQSGIAIDSAIDAIGGSLLTELTLLCKNPAGCGYMTNIQKAVSADGLTAH